MTVTGGSAAGAQRLAAHRDSLLATEVFTDDTLQQLRGDRQASSTRSWVARKRATRELVTVTHDGQTIVPAFQFTADGSLRPELRPLLEALAAGGVDGWQLWTWLTSPSSLLSGGCPTRWRGRSRNVPCAPRSGSPPRTRPDRSAAAVRPPPRRG